MHRRRSIAVIVLVISLGFFALTREVAAQVYRIPWHTLDSGGGVSSNGDFKLKGTIGQPVAGTVMTGGSFAMTGGFWTGVPRPAVNVSPDEFLVTRGTYVSGGLVELADSDNLDLSIQRSTSDILARTEFEVKSVSPYPNPSAFKLTVEASVFARSAVDQRIELLDHANNNWELVDTRPANSFFDATVTVEANGDLSRFVQPVTNIIRARIRYQSVSPRQRFASNTDQVIWTIQ